MKLDRRLLLAGGAGALGATLLTGRAYAGNGGSPNGACTQDVFKELVAAGPRIVAGEPPAARLFDRVAGSWNVDYAGIADDGTRTEVRGELLVGWVLDGRALQDLWIQFPKPGEDRFIGTTLRFYDPDLKKWRVTWVSAIAKAVTVLEGGEEDGRIALYTDSPKGRTRWTFSNITDKAFVWQAHRSTDGGKTWFMYEDHRMYRRA
ncbi:MAG TPA: hypothetical protein VJT80_11780 [Steroidobacteraceae bacterium]|nr:hypothetical protein [Steroidobacteraceae bacterium]